MKTKVYSIASRKGGVGKSVVTMLLASALAKDGKKVLILDCDNQCSIGDWLENEKKLNEGLTALVDIETITARRVQSFLQRFAADYDIIFIDVPRMTDADKNSSTAILLYYCDAVLVPVLGTQIDALSTIDFIDFLKDLKADKKQDGLKFDFQGFINKNNSRKDNVFASDLMKENGLKMFDSSLKDLKLFTVPSLFNSILETKEGRRRFEPFYNEFKTTFKIK